MPSIPPTPITAVVIAKNEEKNLARCLRSLSFCDEIIVVDSGSQDQTQAIARSFGCTVYDHPFTRFGDQKAFAVSKATHDWVLSLDADEEVSESLTQEIKSLIQKPTLNGIWIRSRLVFLGRVFRYGRESKVRVLRVFKRSAGDFDRASVHEKVVLRDPNTAETQAWIHHFSYPDLEHYLAKMNRYTTLGAESLSENTPLYKAYFQLSLNPLKFFQFYIQHLNFMNGFEGFCWSMLSTHAHFIKFVKLIVLLKRR